MTRIIRASEVKPGMEVEWTHAGITRKCIGSVVESAGPQRDVKLRTFEGGAVHIPRDVEVTVLSEHAPPQPEEPTEFGAKVRVRDGRFVRLGDGDLRYHVWHEEGTGYQWTWDQLCARGPVTVVPDQGWTVPADAPEVPERIEEWPEDDTALRKHKWRDVEGDVWVHVKGGWRWLNKQVGEDKLFGFRAMPVTGPWTRVTHA